MINASVVCPDRVRPLLSTMVPETLGEKLYSMLHTSLCLQSSNLSQYHGLDCCNFLHTKLTR